jgi:site-specific recombinase XerD
MGSLQSTETLFFLSETYHPLTINALTLLFGRLRQRAGMTEEQVTPSLLRDTFAVRYLQAGGEPEALRAILGLTGMESAKGSRRALASRHLLGSLLW